MPVGWLAWAAAASLPAPAPRITCEIEMPNWCLAHFSGRTSMVDDGRARIWTLQSSLFMKKGPLVIIESKACGSVDTFVPRFAGRSTLAGPAGQALHSAVYEIAAGGCSLEFRWPVSAEDDASYEQTMRYGVLIGGRQKDTQLYELLR